MASHWTIDNVIHRLGPKPAILPSPAPEYTGDKADGLMFAVESMKRHMTDEGWQLAAGLERAGYLLAGKRLPIDQTDVRRVLKQHDPGVVVLQDKREWDRAIASKTFRDEAAHFHHVGELAKHPEIFKLTVIKDAHQRIPYHKESADEIGAHAWITYYHPRVVCHLAPYVRPEHLLRIYHSVDREIVPSYQPNRKGILLSGATNRTVYPLRWALLRKIGTLPQVTNHPHPGYHKNGSNTPGYLQLLSRYKASICTSSIYGYALRKIVEATACGCVVITDLAEDERMPEIEGNIVRVNPGWNVRRIAGILREVLANYNPERQAHFAERAKAFYDYRASGLRLAADVESLRKTMGRSGEEKREPITSPLHPILPEGGERV